CWRRSIYERSITSRRDRRFHTVPVWMVPSPSDALSGGISLFDDSYSVHHLQPDSFSPSVTCIAIRRVRPCALQDSSSQGGKRYLPGKHEPGGCGSLQRYTVADFSSYAGNRLRLLRRFAELGQARNSFDDCPRCCYREWMSRCRNRYSCASVW